MRWKAIWSRGSSSMTPGVVRGLIKAGHSKAMAHSSGSGRRQSRLGRAFESRACRCRASPLEYAARIPRGVAQPGRALRSGRRSRRFKSCLPDHEEARGGRRPPRARRFGHLPGRGKCPLRRRLAAPRTSASDLPARGCRSPSRRRARCDPCRARCSRPG